MTLPLPEARRNDEVISIGDSQMLRWIDELNGIENADAEAKEIKGRIRALRRREDSLSARREIRRLYDRLDAVQYKPDYLCLIVDSEKDYRRACAGFSVNGIRYVRLLGTNGGVKNSTIVVVSERLSGELRRRIDNGRNPHVPMIPAKFEAYRALTCSGSTPVSMPHGILVVKDCVTQFKEDVVTLSDEADGEPVMREVSGADVSVKESDGYGLMLPSLAERWSAELGLDYVVSGCNTRFSWEKGMVFTFDFLDFADNVAHSRVVRDAWGNEVDLSGVELILTTSMLKLWDSYSSLDEYLRCCAENRYTFGIAKTTPRTLESERDLNYQFIQSYHLTEEQIDELIRPSVEQIADVLGGDYRKAILFLKGRYLNDGNVCGTENDFAKALMIEPEMYNDAFVRKKIYQMIRRRIDDAKIGVLRVHGNYSILCGDPYALCQSIFGLPVTGLLKRGEVYSRYWLDEGAAELACFRAPMSCHSNIRRVRVARGEEVEHWYRHMTACSLLNAWDSITQALNGAD